MPLGSFEGELLRLLAKQRNPDSYVAGATVLHQSARTAPSCGRVGVGGGGQSPGMNAEWIIDWGGRQARLQGQDASQLQLSQPVDLRELRLRWMQASEAALALIGKLPVTERGCL